MYNLSLDLFFHVLSIIFLSILFNEIKDPEKVWMYEEMMTNDDNLESNLLTSSFIENM